MRKLPIILVFSLVAIVLISGCIGQVISPPTGGGGQQQPPAPPPITPAKAECTGFAYFTFVNHNVSWTGGYKIYLENGNLDVRINGIQAGRMPSPEYPVTVSADGKSALNEFIGTGKTIYIFTNSVVTNQKIGENLANFQVRILYDLNNGTTALTDSATCTGVVENW